MEGSVVLPVCQEQRRLRKGTFQDRADATGTLYRIDDSLCQTRKVKNKEPQKPLCHEKPDLACDQNGTGRIEHAINTPANLNRNAEYHQ